MRPETFDAALQAYKRRTPYKPFTVTLVNGDKFEVDHPEALVVRDGMAIFVAPGGVPYLFDHEGVNAFIGDLREGSEA